MNDWNTATQLVWEALTENQMPYIKEMFDNIKNDDQKSQEKFGIPDTPSLKLAEGIFGLVVSEELDYHDIGSELPTGETLVKRMLDTALSSVHWRCLAFALIEKMKMEESLE